MRQCIIPILKFQLQSGPIGEIYFIKSAFLHILEASVYRRQDPFPERQTCFFGILHKKKGYKSDNYNEIDWKYTKMRDDITEIGHFNNL